MNQQVKKVIDGFPTTLLKLYSPDCGILDKS